MGYAEKVLQAGERIVYRAHLHWIAYLSGILLIVAAVILALAAVAPLGEALRLGLIVAALIALFLGLFQLLRVWFVVSNTEIIVTNRRLIYKTGFIARDTVEMNLDKVESVLVEQSLAGRLLGFGRVIVRGAGAGLEPIDGRRAAAAAPHDRRASRMSAAAQRCWDAKAQGAPNFVHPLEAAWLAELPNDAGILDYGCSYGRMTAELAAAGWANVVGVDFSAGMVARGRREHPGLDLRHIAGLPLAEPDGAFDAALLFAVLTCIPADADQRALVAELRRVIRPRGPLYVSDYLLQQADPRYPARYQAGFARHGLYGVWDRDDGGVFRHHTRAALDALLSAFEPVAERELATVTMSGAPATALQLLVRRC